MYLPKLAFISFPAKGAMYRWNNKKLCSENILMSALASGSA
jgi:hypothetical protein